MASNWEEGREGRKKREGEEGGRKEKEGKREVSYAPVEAPFYSLSPVSTGSQYLGNRSELCTEAKQHLLIPTLPSNSYTNPHTTFHYSHSILSLIPRPSNAWFKVNLCMPSASNVFGFETNSIPDVSALQGLDRRCETRSKCVVWRSDRREGSETGDSPAPWWPRSPLEIKREGKITNQTEVKSTQVSCNASIVSSRFKKNAEEWSCSH